MPVVEIDTEAGAAYIRISHEPVAETQLVRDDEIVVTRDLDAKGKVVGIEIVGIREFTLDKLLEYARIPSHVLDASRRDTHYVSA